MDVNLRTRKVFEDMLLVLIYKTTNGYNMQKI